MTRNCAKHTLLVVVAAVTVALLIGTGVAYQWERLQESRAQKQHESMLAAIEACKQHLNQSQGGWPRRWEDIEPTGNWDLRRSVKINFEADPALLAFEHASDFTGVQALFQTKRSYKEELAELIDVLRDFHPPEMTAQ